jgi:CheY-like chemotaxis protein
MSWVSETDLVVWEQGGIACAVVAASVGFDVELRNSQGVGFLRKSAPTRDAARNQAEYLRLLLSADHIPAVNAELKPFALVVEDDLQNCEALTEALKTVGVRALGVHSGGEAVRLARALTPDLVVIDYRLPDISGAEVCRRLRSDPETEGLPIIAVTASPEELRRDGCAADAVLAKPCGLDTFTAAVRLFLRPKVDV